MFVPPFYLSDYITFREIKNERCFYNLLYQHILYELMILLTLPQLESEAGDTETAAHKFLKDADLPTMRFHDLQHSAATILFVAEVNPKVI